MQQILNNFGINAIDAHYMYDHIACIYILKDSSNVVIIETGTKFSIKYLENELNSQGLSFKNVLYIIPTHVHLDHAAGASHLIDICPNAKLIIHPRGARHMINPEKLIKGTIAVYGEKNFKKLYGEIRPIKEDKIIIAENNFILQLNTRKLTFIDTPGHARHHFCIFDSLSKTMFSGDTFGVSYREFDHAGNIMIFPTTTPVQFEPELLINSINNIMSFAPNYIALTHFNAIKPTKKVVDDLKKSIYYFADLAQKFYNHHNAKEKIKEEMLDYLTKKALAINHKLDITSIKNKLTNDIELNTQGLIFWQQKVNH